MSSGQQKKVVVTGDAPITWCIVRDASRHEGRATGIVPDRVRMSGQRCGWPFLHDLLKEMIGAKAQFFKPVLPPSNLNFGQAGFKHSLTMWSRYEKSGTEQFNGYRLDEYLGWAVQEDSRKLIPPDAVQYHQIQNDPTTADLVVIEDWGLGYCMAQHLWPLSIQAVPTTGQPSPWVVVKMSQRLFEENPLCRDLVRRPANPGYINSSRDMIRPVVLVVTMDDVRKMKVQLSRETSLDHLLEDLLKELETKRDLQYFQMAAMTVFAFEDVGALIYSGGTTRKWSCVFDPRDNPSGKPRHRSEGRVPGGTTCLTAAIAAQLIDCASTDDLMARVTAGVKIGLAAKQELHKLGFLGDDKADRQETRRDLTFPFHKILDVLKPASAPSNGVIFATTASFDWPPETQSWSLLSTQKPDDLDELADRILLQGAERALKGLPIPVEAFGKLVTLDRMEIESYRDVRRLLGEYARSGSNKPLSIAVFGQPGSGKSFAVQQLASKEELQREIDFKTFNLSQFSDAKDLLGALHQVRDSGLKGNLAVVFWDEFDSKLQSKPLGWLRYFLSPMEDGTFQDGQVTHSVGAAVFVFAGGTSDNFASFETVKGDEKEWKELKVPDFISRLKGTLDIPGVNPPDLSERIQLANSTVEDADSERQIQFEELDPSQVISCSLRRALIFRSEFKSNYGQLIRHEDLQIDDGVLNAILKTRKYRHGVRSMKALLSMSLLTGRQRFERSCLPHDLQMNLHVDADDFRSHLNAR